MFARLTRFAAAAVLGMAATIAHAEERVVNVYNWSDYIAKDTLEKFTKETGIKVNYDTYGENEALEAKLLAGKSGYDVVFPSASPFFAHQVKAGVYQKLDQAKIPNAKGLSKETMASLAKVDPGNAFGVPYMIAATGIGYNVDMVKKVMPDAPTGSWAMLFDPAVASRLKSCGVSLLDTPTEAVPAMLAFQGRDPMEQTKESLDAVMGALAPLRGNYRFIHSEKYRDALASGDICVAHGYVGDLVQVRERAAKAKKPQTIAIAIPKEGAIVNIDVMAIPADAPHADEAHAFINFILRPDIVAEITNETGYANAVPAADTLVDEALSKDPVIYPPQEMQAKLYTAPPPAGLDFDRARARAWSKFKAAKK